MEAKETDALGWDHTTNTWGAGQPGPEYGHESFRTHSPVVMGTPVEDPEVPSNTAAFSETEKKMLIISAL